MQKMSEADWLDALLRNRQLEYLRDYLKRGRLLAGRQTEELNLRWIELVNTWAKEEKISPQHRLEMNDIEAELRTRNLGPPKDRAVEGIKRVAEWANRTAKVLLSDPKEKEEWRRDLTAEIERLRDPSKPKS